MRGSSNIATIYRQHVVAREVNLNLALASDAARAASQGDCVLEDELIDGLLCCGKTAATLSTE